MGSNPSDINLNEAYNLFKKALNQQGLSSSTILAYLTDLKQLIAYLKEKNLNFASQITEEELLNFQKKLEKNGYSTVSLARKINAWRKFFQWLKKENLISHSPVSNLIIPKFKKNPPRILSPMEYRALRDTCRENPRTAALIEIFLQTGLKVSEVAQLTLDDLNHDKIIIRKSKTNLSRVLPLNQPLKTALERYLKVRPKTQNKQLFVTKNGTPLLVRNLTTIMMRCFKEAEIKNASLNALRHTWIYHQLEYGVPLETVSRLAGHKRISTTATYLSLIEGKKSPNKNKLKIL